MTTPEQIAQLLYKRSAGTLTDSEQQTLVDWLSASLANRQWLAYIDQEEHLEQKLTDFHPENHQRITDAIFAKIISGRSGLTQARPAHRIHFLKTAWVRYAAAVILLFGIGAYLWNTEQKEKPLITDTKPVPVKNDVAPGSNKAILTLSDGRKVELTPETGNITETGTNIQNANGRLEYGKAEKVVFNTMSTPRGGQYQLTLPDGTNVWLNAASSITYPTAFTSTTREVTITGEAYFDVTRNPAKPFIVKAPKEDITVLGTEFNVNAYADNNAAKTSLIEGSVKIQDIFLKPGQAYQQGKIITTNIEQDIAWKNGYFSFENKSLEAIMQELARWYDLEVSYAGTIPRREFLGKVGRNLKLSQVLNVLEKLGVRVQLENNRRVVIMP
jgi:ferric-dicitrate binding protein FerR (iron transport regulator)